MRPLPDPGPNYTESRFQGDVNLKLLMAVIILKKIPPPQSLISRFSTSLVSTGKRIILEGAPVFASNLFRGGHE
jgi:hypothetical protein